MICAAYATAFVPWAARAATAENALRAGALKESSSLYLREAASSEVRWQPWGSEAFDLARKLKRPMLIDIGAIWCHWCHVMDDGTYANAGVAAFINRNFVPVKVDTDERPDIDSFYQGAAAAFGAGGWPLTVFATPDGAPFYITSYLPPNGPRDRPGYGMLYLLEHVARAYAADPKFRAMAREVAAAVAAGATRVSPEKSSSAQLLRRIIAGMKDSYDSCEGGFSPGQGSRFYDFPLLELALAHGFFGHPEYTRMAADTLTRIAAGGVYDQLGGGFHRYSTDARWRVPHFGKMLYDQAMGLRTYALAYRATGDPRLAAVARSIVGYVNRTMLDPRTLTFYAHQDADAFPGDDGSYYTWTPKQIERAAGAGDAKLALAWFGVSENSALAHDGGCVLRRAMTLEELARRFHIKPDEAARKVRAIRAKLLAVRERRQRPPVDKTLLTDRNALMADAYLVAGEALSDPALVQSGLANIDFIRGHLRGKDGTFYHVWDGARASVPGLVADQVYMMRALIDAYQVSGKSAYLTEAIRLSRLAFEHFRDPKSGLLENRVPAAAETVLAAAKAGAGVFFDDPMPSVQAVAAESFQSLGTLTSHAAYAKRTDELLAPALAMLTAVHPPPHGALGRALERQAQGETLVAISGPPKDRRAAALWQAALGTYRPDKVVMLIEGEGAKVARLSESARAMVRASADRKTPLAFVCAGTACANPAATPEALARIIRTLALTRGREEAGAGKQASTVPAK